MIVITAPTGQIGRQVLDRVLESDEAVRVVARDPSRLAAEVRDRAQVVEGSHSDPDVVDGALAGADSVFWLVSAGPGAPAIADYYRDFTRPAGDAMLRRGVGRVIGVSSLGRGWPEDAGNLSAAFAMDELIETAGVAYRSLQMPFFMENLLFQLEGIEHEGTLKLPNSADRTLPIVATGDIAATAAGLLLDHSWTGQAGVPVIGPDDLSPRQMASVLTETLGHPVDFEQVSLADHRAALLAGGLSPQRAQGLIAMVAAQNQGIYDPEARDAPRAATSFRQWCCDVLEPAVRT